MLMKRDDVIPLGYSYATIDGITYVFVLRVATIPIPSASTTPPLTTSASATPTLTTSASSTPTSILLTSTPPPSASTTASAHSDLPYVDGGGVIGSSSTRFSPTGSSSQLVMAVVVPIVVLIVLMAALGGWYTYRRWRRVTRKEKEAASINGYLSRGLLPNEKYVITPTAFQGNQAYVFDSAPTKPLESQPMGERIFGGTYLQHQLAETTKPPIGALSEGEAQPLVVVKNGPSVPVQSRWIATPLEALRSFRQSMRGDISGTTQSSASLYSPRSAGARRKSLSSRCAALASPMHLRTFKLKRTQPSPTPRKVRFQSQIDLTPGLPTASAEISPQILEV